MRRICSSWLLATLLLPLAGVASPPAAPAARKPPGDPTNDPAMVAAGFLASHPDLRFRKLGMEAYGKGNHAEAFGHFQRASFYADKPAQSMVAEMLWNGQGTTQDRVLAYAWMDLAAERGYAVFVAMRERYWASLERGERLQVAARGEAVYARYGDAVAQPRIATVLRRASRNVTGSRTGMVGNVKIIIPGSDLESEGTQIDAATFYNPRYWDPQLYQAWHDSIWMNPRISSVSVGEVEDAATDAAVDGKDQQEPSAGKQD